MVSYAFWNSTTNVYNLGAPMNAARLGRIERAIEYLLDVNFACDDLGMPVGGPRVPTSYFPGSASLLMAVGMIAGGWDGVQKGEQFPENWVVQSEGLGGLCR